jgi:hypothetical protein
MTKSVPPRIVARPDPRDWDPDDLLTLPEAAALFWPSGPLTVSSLRTAIRDARLEVAVIARKHFVTPSAVRAMGRRRDTPTSGDASTNKKADHVPWSKTGL